MMATKKEEWVEGNKNTVVGIHVNDVCGLNMCNAESIKGKEKKVNDQIHDINEEVVSDMHNFILWT